MITYAKSSKLMAYLINHSMSGLCKKYLERKGLKALSSLFLVLGVTLPNSILAGEKISIPMDISAWLYKGSQFECRLIHSEVPYGKFYFLAEPSQQISFVADVHSNNSKWQSASLKSQSAPWEKELSSQDQAFLTLASASHQFTFKQGSESLLTAVNSGNWIALSLVGSDASAISGITLPTIQIHEALTSFNQCRERLPKLSYSQARDVNLPFQFGQKTLNRRQKGTLAALYSYISVDDRVTKILIDGHTDSVGSKLANLTVSRQRAEQVADALVQLGVKRSMIEVRAHGSRYPLASNKTKAGQAKNRRVMLRLVRDNERAVTKRNQGAEKDTQQQKVKVQ